MNEFLNSMKADLLSRRMLPILAVLGVALLAAVAYAVLGGSSTPSTPTAAVAPAPAVTAPAGIAVTQAPTSTVQPVDETTSGSTHRAAGSARNPFAPLPGAKKAASSATTTTTGSSTTTTSTSGSSTSGSSTSGSSTSGASTTTPESGSSSSGTTEGTTAPSKKTSTPSKQKTVYKVSVVFGTAPAGTPPLSAQLTPFPNLKRQQPLPSASQPLIVFRGVIAGGKSATFTLVGEAILRGSAACLPSASQCQAIDLKPGQTEELEYIPLGSTAVVYQLQVVSIVSSKASASAASRPHDVARAALLGQERRTRVRRTSRFHSPRARRGLGRASQALSAQQIS
jgi:hypothetical protein